MSDPVSTFTVASGVLDGVGSLLKDKEDRRQYDNRIREEEYNAQQFRYDAQMARYEKATAFTQQIARGRQDIATGTGAMVAAGNYGTSAQAQIFGSALNIMKDLFAIQYRYDNDAIQKLNAAKVAEYNAAQYKKAKKNVGGLSTLIGLASTAGNTYLRGWERGIWGPSIEDIRGW